VHLYVDEVDHHLFDSFNIYVDIHKSVIPEDHTLSRLKITTTVDSLQCNLSEANIKLLCDLCVATVISQKKAQNSKKLHANYTVPMPAESKFSGLQQNILKPKIKRKERSSSPPTATTTPTRRSRTLSDINIASEIESHVDRTRSSSTSISNPINSNCNSNSNSNSNNNTGLEIFDEFQFLDAYDNDDDDDNSENINDSIFDSQIYRSTNSSGLTPPKKFPLKNHTTSASASFFSDHEIEPDEFMNPTMFQKKRRPAAAAPIGSTTSSLNNYSNFNDVGYLNSENLARLNPPSDKSSVISAPESSENSFHSAESIGDHVAFRNDLESAIVALETELELDQASENKLSHLRNVAELRALKIALFEIENKQKEEIVEFAVEDLKNVSTASGGSSALSSSLLFKGHDVKTKEVALRAKALLKSRRQSTLLRECDLDRVQNPTNSVTNTTVVNRELYFFSFAIKELVLKVSR